MGKKHLILFIGCLSLAVLASSCNKDDGNGPRAESIEVYATPTAESEGEDPVDYVVVGVTEGLYDVLVKTNCETLTATWQNSGTSAWASVESFENHPSLPGYKVVTLKVKRLATTCYYTRRSGTLLLTDTSTNLGKFIKVHQGATARVSLNFDFLKYGTADPRIDSNDALISKWTASQQTYKVGSTPFKEDGIAYLYGKNSCIRLGDDKGHGADVITPYADAMRADSLLMVSFKAVGHTSLEGVKDPSKFTVEVIGGGVIRDYEETAATSIEFEAPYYDLYDDDFPGSMFKGADYLVFVKGTELNPITSSTQIRISVGSLSEVSATPTRLYVDNIYVRTLNEQYDEDYFTENGGSGLDQILGKEIDGENE